MFVGGWEGVKNLRPPPIFLIKKANQELLARNL